MSQKGRLSRTAQNMAAMPKRSLLSLGLAVYSSLLSIDSIVVEPPTITTNCSCLESRPNPWINLLRSRTECGLPPLNEWGY